MFAQNQSTEVQRWTFLWVTNAASQTIMRNANWNIPKPDNAFLEMQVLSHLSFLNSVG
jgi:hypothetical protein